MLEPTKTSDRRLTAEIGTASLEKLARGEAVTVRIPAGATELLLRLSGKAVHRLAQPRSLFERVFGKD